MFGPSKAELEQQNRELLQRANNAEDALASIHRATNTTVAMSEQAIPYDSAQAMVLRALQDVVVNNGIGTDAESRAVGMMSLEARAAIVEARAAEILADETELRQAALKDPVVGAELEAEARAELKSSGELTEAKNEVDREFIEERKEFLLQQERDDAESQIDTDAVDAEIKASEAYKAEVKKIRATARATVTTQRTPIAIAAAQAEIDAEEAANAPNLDKGLIAQHKASSEGLAHRELRKAFYEGESDRAIIAAAQQDIDDEELEAALSQRRAFIVQTEQTHAAAERLLEKLQLEGLDLSELEPGTTIELTLGDIAYIPHNNIDSGQLLQQTTGAIKGAIEHIVDEVLVKKADHLHTKQKRAHSWDKREAYREAVKYVRNLGNMTISMEMIEPLLVELIDQLENTQPPEVHPTTSRAIITAANRIVLTKDSDGTFLLREEHNKEYEAQRKIIANAEDKLLLGKPGTTMAIGSTRIQKGLETLDERLWLNREIVYDREPESEHSFSTVSGGDLVEVKINGVSSHAQYQVEYA